jgi:hypothetical protein
MCCVLCVDNKNEIEVEIEVEGVGSTDQLWEQL